MTTGRDEKDTDSSTFYTYGDFDHGLLAEIRRETYGEDLGQFSWITAEEFRKFFRRLELDARSRVLDVACGSGGPAIFVARTTGCHVTGVDINERGITTARQSVEARGLQDRLRFEHADASRALPFADGSFDAIISIDAMNHLYNRAELLAEWRRLLRPGGRFLFTDATIVTGILTRDEILARSNSMGQFIFTPAGLHERLIESAGFVDLHVEDVTETIVEVAKRWHDAREKRRDQLSKTESQGNFDDLQKMLATAHKLASERRLSRFAYIGAEARVISTPKSARAQSCHPEPAKTASGPHVGWWITLQP